jgi:hypothetical protein
MKSKSNNRHYLDNVPKLNDVVDINGSKVFVENGKVKTILNEKIRQSGYMTVEEMEQLIIAKITKIYQMQNSR